MSDLLSLVIDRWKKDFKGISALEIANILGISNEEAMARLRVLEADGTVRVRPCELGQGIKFTELGIGDASLKVATEFEMVDTLMAFPSRSVLGDAFHRDRIDYGVFTNRLHLGDSQIQLYYFRREVLDRAVIPARTSRPHAGGAGRCQPIDFLQADSSRDAILGAPEGKERPWAK